MIFGHINHLLISVNLQMCLVLKAVVIVIVRFIWLGVVLFLEIHAPETKRPRESKANVTTPRWDDIGPLLIVWPITVRSELEKDPRKILEANFPTDIELWVSTLFTFYWFYIIFYFKVVFTIVDDNLDFWYHDLNGRFIMIRLFKLEKLVWTIWNTEEHQVCFIMFLKEE